MPSGLRSGAGSLVDGVRADRFEVRDEDVARNAQIVFVDDRRGDFAVLEPEPEPASLLDLPRRSTRCVGDPASDLLGLVRPIMVVGC